MGMKIYIASPDMSNNNGIGQVLKFHRQYLPQVGIKLVKNPKNADVVIDHLGVYPGAEVHFSHGLWFGEIDQGKAQQNANIISVIKTAKAVIVPSEYVAETFRRDLRINPVVIGHGVEFNDWQKRTKKQDVILWNKNRASKVCNPQYVMELAKLLPNQKFISTFGEPLPNVEITGVLPFSDMKRLIQSSKIYLATARETFGIGTLEAMSCGNPVIGFAWGGTKDIVTHKVDGYLVNPGDTNGLAKAVEYVIMNYSKMSRAAKKKAKTYNWLRVANKIKGVCEQCLQ